MRYYLKGDLLSHFIVEPTPRRVTGADQYKLTENL